MSTPTEYQRVAAELAALRAGVEALADRWGDEDEQVEHVGSCQNFGCGDCVVAACTFDLRNLLEARA